MLKIYNWSRGAGKTTKAIELMEKDDKAILLVNSDWSVKRLYPKEIQKRIMTISQFLDSRGVDPSKIVIDEGFLQDKETMAHLYYHLGYLGIDTISFGTLEAWSWK